MSVISHKVHLVDPSITTACPLGTEQRGVALDHGIRARVPVIQPLNRQIIPIQVPPPQTTAAASGPSTQIVLEIKDDGTLAINGQPVPMDQLDAQIHSIYDARPVKLLFVKPGPNRVYQDIIDVTPGKLSPAAR